MPKYQAYLVTLNEDEDKGKSWDRRDLSEKVEQTKVGILADEWWNVANRSITHGDRLFLSRQGFIECHHLVPLHELRGLRKTRLEDLALVCSNCHRMLHRQRPCLTVNELRRLRKGLSP
jgi:hypothetical protein